MAANLRSFHMEAGNCSIALWMRTNASMLFSGCLKSKDSIARSTILPIGVPPSSRDQVVLIPSKGSFDKGLFPSMISMYSVLLPKVGALPKP